jgi:hypothetical protein
MLNARSQFQRRIRARAAAAPDINKCAMVAALLSAILMVSIGLMLG